MANISYEGENQKGNVSEAGWANAFGSQDFSNFEKLFTEDATLQAPTINGVIRGRKQVAATYGTASKYYEYCNFTNQAVSGSPFDPEGTRTWLEWEVKTLDGMKMWGFTIIDKNAKGEIFKAVTLHYPLGEALLFSNHLREGTKGIVDEKYFFTTDLAAETLKKYPNYRDELK